MLENEDVIFYNFFTENLHKNLMYITFDTLALLLLWVLEPKVCDTKSNTVFTLIKNCTHTTRISDFFESKMEISFYQC